LNHEFPLRRLCRVRVVGVDGALELHELRCETVNDRWLACRDRFEQAMSQFESGDIDDASSTLDDLRHEPEMENDKTIELLQQYFSFAQKQEEFDPVISLEGK
jgi:adenylate cyclase